MEEATDNAEEKNLNGGGDAPRELWTVICEKGPASSYAIQCVDKRRHGAVKAYHEKDANENAKKTEEGTDAAKITPQTLFDASANEPWLAALKEKIQWTPAKVESSLCFAARNGDLVGMTLCIVWGIRDHGTKWGAKDFDRAIGEAARNGQQEAITEFLRWGADPIEAFRGAAEGDQVEIMKCLLSDSSTKDLIGDFDYAIQGAARFGSLGAIGYLKALGRRTLFQYPLSHPRSSTKRDEEREQRIDVASSNFEDTVLAFAAVWGQVEVAEYAKCTGATNFDAALSIAASSGMNIDMITLLCNWGGNPDLGLRRAAGKGNLAAMSLLKEGGANNFDTALIDAAQFGQLEAMTCLRDWGATDFSTALQWMLPDESPEARDLLREWGATEVGE